MGLQPEILWALILPSCNFKSDEFHCSPHLRRRLVEIGEILIYVWFHNGRRRTSHERPGRETRAGGHEPVTHERTQSERRETDASRDSGARRSTDGTPAGAVASLHSQAGNQAVQRAHRGGAKRTAAGQTVQRQSNQSTASSRTSFLQTVPGHVPALSQPTDMTCWATTAAMMLSWRDNRSYSVGAAMHTVDEESPTVTHEVEWGDTLWDIAEQYYGVGYEYPKIQKATPRLSTGDPHIEPGWELVIPDRWYTKFDNNVGLGKDEHSAFMSDVGLQAQAPARTYTVEAIRELLDEYGPLWFTADVNATSGHFSVHARVIDGITGDYSPGSTWIRVIDPAHGNRNVLTFGQFLDQLEEDMNTPELAGYVQMIHWP